jgi:hypothetical protein
MAKGKVIITKLPGDARRNVAKLERGAQRQAEHEAAVTENYKALKAIWRDEGIDAALLCAPRLKFAKYDAFKFIEAWAFPKQFAERAELEQIGRENSGLQRCT